MSRPVHGVQVSSLKFPAMYRRALDELVVMTLARSQKNPSCISKPLAGNPRVGSVLTSVNTVLLDILNWRTAILSDTDQYRNILSATENPLPWCLHLVGKQILLVCIHGPIIVNHLHILFPANNTMLLFFNAAISSVSRCCLVCDVMPLTLNLAMVSSDETLFPRCPRKCNIIINVNITFVNIEDAFVDLMHSVCNSVADAFAVVDAP